MLTKPLVHIHTALQLPLAFMLGTILLWMIDGQHIWVSLTTPVASAAIVCKNF